MITPFATAESAPCLEPDFSELKLHYKDNSYVILYNDKEDVYKCKYCGSKATLKELSEHMVSFQKFHEAYSGTSAQNAPKSTSDRKRVRIRSFNRAVGSTPLNRFTSTESTKQYYDTKETKGATF